MGIGRTNAHGLGVGMVELVDMLVEEGMVEKSMGDTETNILYINAKGQLPYESPD